MNKSTKIVMWAAPACALVLAAGLAACTPEQRAPMVDEASQQVETPAADEFGVVDAESWASAYPNQVASYERNAENAPGEEKHNYLELYPALSTMYAGYGFSKGYDEAASHLYTLDSILATPRVNDSTLANCITCKTPQFTALVNAEGDGVYAERFNDLIGQFDEPISCYNCHENDPSTVTVASKFFLKSMGEDVANVPVEAQSCGQCHNEYYFDPTTKATTNPYVGTAAMTPDAILAYYDERGFSDWAYPGTGTPMIKVQHPEFETLYGGSEEDRSQMVSMGYTCADCHMGTSVAEDGSKYTNHEWKSPLENQELLDTTCNSCHGDLAAEVAAIQDAEEARVQSISMKIKDMVDRMVAQVADGSLSGDRLSQLQGLHRTAQFYWDFVMVENSEGAHNPELTNDTLDKAEAAVDQALSLL